MPTLQKNVLYTICYSEFYGTQRSVLSVAAGLDPSRYVPVVAAPHDDAFYGALASAGIRTVPLPFKNVLDAGTIGGLCGIIGESKIDLIHAHLGISTALSIAASALSGNIPVVVTRHFIEDRYTTIKNPAVRKAYGGVYRKMNSRAKRMIFVSEAVREGVERREGLIGDRGIVIPNAVRNADFAPARFVTPGGAAVLKKNLGFPEDCFLVLTLSRLVHEKRLDVLIRAAAEIRSAHPDAYFLIAGGGKLLERLESLAAELGVEDRIKFAGYVGKTVDVFTASDVFVLSAEAEPFGIAILEAMASGLPVVAARSGGPLDIIHDGADGLFFEPGDPRDLAEKIALLKSDAELRRKIAEGGALRAEYFEEKKVAVRVQEVYDEALAES